MNGFGSSRPCDGDVDEADAADATNWFQDADHDGYGWASVVANSCEAPAGFVSNDLDCDDTNAQVAPGEDEYCDGDDNDCDGDVDEDDAMDALTWFLDADGDGYGGGTTTQACLLPTGYSANADDCDDGDSSVNPGASEYCDGHDDDCDGVIDEPESLDATDWFVDGDGDGYGAGNATQACSQPSGRVALDGDCDDADPGSNPGAAEICGDGADNDCDSVRECVPLGGLTSTDAQWSFSATGPFMEVADFDGSGTVGVAVYSTSTSSLHVVYGPLTASLGTEEFDHDMAFGVDAGVDVDGDGGAEILVYDSQVSSGYELYLGLGSTSASTAIFYSTSPLGVLLEDLDGDGLGEVLIGGTSSVAIRYGATTGGTQGQDTIAVGTNAVLSESGDLDGDGARELALATNSSLYVIATPLPASVSSAMASWTVGSSDLDLSSDVNSDGYNDILVGAAGYAYGAWTPGAAYIEYGAATVVGGTLSSRVSGYSSSHDGARIGASVCAGDVDGDGNSDLIVGAPGSSAVYLFYGPLSSGTAVGNRDAVVTGVDIGEYLTTGDTNADGYDDFGGAGTTGYVFLPEGL